MIFVKRALLLGHRRIGVPGLGNQHGHDVRQAAPGQRQHLDGIVERACVAQPRLNHRKNLLDVVAKLVGCQHRLARVHPVHVASYGVDFAVMADVAIRMRQRPSGKCIGGKTLVDEAQRAARGRIAQFLIKFGDLRGQQQPFIHDGARGQRRHVEKVLLADIERSHGGLRPAADDVQLALQLIPGPAVCAAQKHLFDIGLHGARFSPDGVAVQRRVAPAEHGQALFAGDFLHHSLADQPLLALDRQEHHADAVRARLWQGKA